MLDGWRKAHAASRVDLDDLISAGNEGLLLALDRFRAGMGSRFAAYARYWIVNKIRIHVCYERWSTHISDYMYKSVLAYNAARRRLKSRLYREPRREEVKLSARHLSTGRDSRGVPQDPV
jgi:DNA-directed RNA polymerase specialized sigma subunit